VVTSLSASRFPVQHFPICCLFSPPPGNAFPTRILQFPIISMRGDRLFLSFSFFLCCCTVWRAILVCCLSILGWFPPLPFFVPGRQQPGKSPPPPRIRTLAPLGDPRHSGSTPFMREISGGHGPPHFCRISVVAPVFSREFIELAVPSETCRDRFLNNSFPWLAFTLPSPSPGVPKEYSEPPSSSPSPLQKDPNPVLPGAHSTPCLWI